MAKNKPTISKHDIIRAVKEMESRLNFIMNHVRMIDNIVDSYIRMNKHQDKLKKYIEKESKNAQDTEHKQSGRSAKTSK